ncbi:hypothetical protein ACIPPJ_35485 [Streptomyces sp. NPDC086091]|uniref:hypothetical protein n=1 Tax=Streptomyces sp. NPDC086091 TaxID=3365751 RepID=UPI003822BEA8
MNNDLLHGDLCPMCCRRLTLRKTVEVRSAQSHHPTRTDTKPYCESCATDMARAQEWADMMRARYEN